MANRQSWRGSYSTAFFLWTWGLLLAGWNPGLHFCKEKPADSHILHWPRPMALHLFGLFWTPRGFFLGGGLWAACEVATCSLLHLGKRSEQGQLGVTSCTWPPLPNKKTALVPKPPATQPVQSFYIRPLSQDWGSPLLCLIQVNEHRKVKQNEKTKEYLSNEGTGMIPRGWGGP